MTIEEFFLRTNEVNECREWMRARDYHGYGRVWVDGKMPLAHRWIYEQFFGPIPVGLEIDHLCRNRACVNPKHLEAVSHRVNTRRAMKERCPQGHLYDENNLVHARDGSRRCRVCFNAWHRRYYHQKQNERRA